MDRTKGLTKVLGIVSGVCGLVSLIVFFTGAGSYSLMAAIADLAICYLSFREADRERQILVAVFAGLVLAEILAFLAGDSFPLSTIVGAAGKLIGLALILIYLGKISYDTKKPIIGGAIVLIFAIVSIVMTASAGGLTVISILRTILSVVPVVIITIFIATDTVNFD